ncbi:MAG: L-seryl-tRNA(Sec) selenium transferase, partial [Candidatus Aminicenantes bacterium]|nr:L-seryl-tRNA(Sec) selenium transferase [Candidatus Aminicenantes bacterium]
MFREEKERLNLWRSLPSVDSLLHEAKGRDLISQFGQELVVSALRQVLQDLRLRIKAQPASLSLDDLSKKNILEQAEKLLSLQFEPSIRRAINASGVIIHTGLGRALLSSEAISLLNEILSGPCTLAINLETGRRGDRDSHLAELLTRLTGAEGATVVNNNAAATLLILNTLAKGKEVIVSRGQLIEIGGSFRLPEVMAMSGAILREVGTTNKTHLYDYERAINDSTAAILRVHHSNYKIVGFTSEPTLADLVALGKKHNLPVIDDLGSGALIDLRAYGLEPEPMVQDSVRAVSY